MSGKRPAQWIVYIEGLGPVHFDDLKEAEMHALDEANDTPDLDIALYELSAIACSKVSKAKLRLVKKG